MIKFLTSRARAREVLLLPSDSYEKQFAVAVKEISDKKEYEIDDAVEIADLSFKFFLPDHHYYPTDLPELFLTFIGIEPNRDDILNFAKQHGVLGLATSDHVLMYLSDSGERLSSWLTEIVCLRHVYRLWCAIKSQNTDALAHVHRKWVQKRQELAELSLANPIIKRQDLLDAEAGLAPMSSPSEIAALPLETIAWREIRVILNGALQQHGLVLRCTENSDDSGLTTSFAPKTLIATLWLQFLELTIGENWKVCDYCGKPFKAKSKKRRYCTASHNQLAYLKRKQAKK